jgi:hypothetical protein
MSHFQALYGMLGFLFSACRFSGINGAAIFYTSDIIKKKPFYSNLDSLSSTKVTRAIEKGSDILRAFIK